MFNISIWIEESVLIFDTLEIIRQIPTRLTKFWMWFEDWKQGRI